MKWVKNLPALFLIFNFTLHSQNENQKWYFGNYAGLDFATSPPTILTNGALSTSEGCSSIADGAGNLLFYTDGITVYNKVHAIMANGTGLFGHSSNAQAALIVKQPGNASMYYVFTPLLNITGGLFYTVVDMSLAAGMGSVTIKNTLMYTPTSERLAGVRHCNGQDIWIISHESKSNTFRAYLLTSAGLNTGGVFSSAGSNPQNNDRGTIKISPNAKKLGMTIDYHPSSNAELFDFDPSTGIISNAFSLGSISGAYGCEFSPDGTKFYCGPWTLPSAIYQWDLSAGSQTAILASKFSVSTSSVSKCSMQLAPDGKIYVARDVKSDLGVIHSPNAGGVACNYVDAGQSIAPKTNRAGLPNCVVPGFLDYIPPFSYSVHPAMSCLSISFTAIPPVNTPPASCSYPGYTVAAMKWDFGDPFSGAANTSTLQGPIHIYSGPGMYIAQLILYAPDGSIISTQNQILTIGLIPLTSSAGSSLCIGNSLTLSASGNITYSWSTGGNSSSIVISPTINTNYTVIATDLNACLNKTTFQIHVFPKTFALTGNTITCPGVPIVQTASGLASYTWNTGANTPSITITPLSPATCTVSGEDANGCKNTTTVLIDVHSLPSLTISSPTVCSGETITLTAASTGTNGSTTYTWMPGNLTSASLAVSPTAITSYTVSGMSSDGCFYFNTHTVNPLPLPVISVSGSRSVCSGSSVKLTASGASTYTWNTGAVTNTLHSAPFTNTVYTVKGTDLNGCSTFTSILVSTKPLPVLTLNQPTACAGGSATFFASSNGTQNLSFLWQPGGATTPSLLVSPASTSGYTVTAFLDSCSVSRSSTVTVLNPAMPVTDFSYMPVCQNVFSTTPLVPGNFNYGGEFSSEKEIHVDKTTGNIDLFQSNSGTYTITYSFPAQNCFTKGIRTAGITIYEVPELHVSENIQIGPGTQTILKAGGAVSYTWDAAPGISCLYCSHPTVFPEQTTLYCVSTSNLNCKTKACTLVKVGCEGSDFSLPNAFSPNGDGTNDEFCIQGWDLCIKEFSVLIFNRWGENIFASNDPRFCWDGSYHNQPLNSDVFVYVIQASFSNGTQLNKKGNISLLR